MIIVTLNDNDFVAGDMTDARGHAALLISEKYAARVDWLSPS